MDCPFQQKGIIDASLQIKSVPNTQNHKKYATTKHTKSCKNQEEK